MPETLFTVWVNLFERGLCRRRRHGAGPWRDQRHRHHGDQARQAVRAGGDRHLRQRREMRRGDRARRGPCDQLPDRPTSSTRSSAGPRSRASRSCSTWSAATMSPRNLACLADDGRHVSIAFQRGANGGDLDRRHHAPAADPDRLDAPRRAISRSRRWSATRSPETVWPYVEGNRLKPVMDQSFPLEQAAAAHARMEAGDHVGKIVLTIG